MSEGSGGWLDFEQPLVELETKIRELEDLASSEEFEVRDELQKLEGKAEQLRHRIFSRLTRWQTVQLARHSKRPQALDYIDRMTTGFCELHGDRRFGDDGAIVGGIAGFRGRKVMVLGHQKGRDLKERLARNFGMPHPEGYRKAMRLMELAGRFGRPILSLIDTQGAFPGVEAEERGQSEAIARNLFVMARLPVPIVGVVIGEGGSGGALAMAVCDRIYILQHAVYSVISPEGCAAILWGDRAKAKDAAEALRVTAPDVEELGIVDGVIPEPEGGAHRDPAEAARLVGDVLETAFTDLAAVPVEELLANRMEKYSRMGRYLEDGVLRGGGAS
ncbi:MAG: acetyl-CoA carboxylase carboxyltransferase subunit alpha [Gemmatimonadota bacterium]|nr:acetyl-CoA carboxylase carboxyltransferase subunit alpha [Gemmatimonadota bacterium]MDP6802785.1 acetyl-CoA carboxylase carboxyltransferase subunit alpha [Gemmatimonadota bacterium]